MTAITISPAELASDVSTLGWDLVYAVSTRVLNARLAATMTPAVMSTELDGDRIVGTLTRWTVVQGGSGPRLNLQVQIADGVLTEECVPTAFSGAVLVEVTLSYFFRENARALAVDIAGESGEPFIVHRSHFDQPLTRLQRATLETAIEIWLQAHPEFFEQALALIDISPMESEVAHSWLRPTLVNYAYCDRNEDGDGILAVLAMTNDRPHPLHDGQVCATAIPPGLDAAFLISPHLLLDWIIRPALASLYPIGNPAALALEDNPPRLVLPAAIDIPAVEENGQSYPARLTQLSVVFSGNALRCESEVRVEKEALFDYTHVRSRHQLVVEHDAAGKPHILFVEAVPPVVTQSSEMKASFIRKTSNIANTVLLVGTALAFLITGPIGATIMLLSVTTFGIFKALPALEYYLDRTEPHPVDLLSLNATSVFAWAGGGTFTLESVSLVESLRLEGNLWSDPE